MTPYRASISRRGVILSCARLHLLFHADVGDASTPAMERPICVARAYIRLRSSPKSLMAMLAFVPESMASIRCRDGLAYLHCQSLQVAQPVADIGQEFVARTPVQHERALRVPMRLRRGRVRRVRRGRSCGPRSVFPVFRGGFPLPSVPCGRTLRAIRPASWRR